MLKITIVYYENGENFRPDYGREHTETITAATAADVMREYFTRGENHDLNKYTPRHIAYIEEI